MYSTPTVEGLEFSNYLFLLLHLILKSDIRDTFFIYFSFFIFFSFILLWDLTSSVIIVFGNWIKKNRYVFNPDGRWCRFLHLMRKQNMTNLRILYSMITNWRSRVIQFSWDTCSRINIWKRWCTILHQFTSLILNSWKVRKA